MTEDNHLKNIRKEKIRALKELGINPYEYKFKIKNHSSKILEAFKSLKKGENTKTKVSIAGRIMSLRIMGKASFGHLQDKDGRIQFYITQNNIGKRDYSIFKKLDIGDIIGIQGNIFKTMKGEISVLVKELKLLTKSIFPLPEKWHGLKDKELRYRMRYLDLIVNPEIKEIFEIRRKIISAIREFYTKEGFIEVETPILQPIYGGTTAKPFESHLNALKMKVYMRISNELYLKRLIVGGYEKVFEFSQDFRNEGIDKYHNPEFLQVETMFSYANYQDNMKFSERALKFISKKAIGTTKLPSGVNLNKWGKMSMLEAVKKYTKTDFNKLDFKEAKKTATKLKVDAKDCNSYGQVLQKVFEEKVEEKLKEPTFIYNFPAESHKLAKVDLKDPRFTESFEIYINGIELGLSYSEENDPEALKMKWKESETDFNKGDEEAERMDIDFIKALSYGMPPVSGLGIGVDRLTMLLTGAESIRDIILFPFMRPEK